MYISSIKIGDDNPIKSALKYAEEMLDKDYTYIYNEGNMIDPLINVTIKLSWGSKINYSLDTVIESPDDAVVNAAVKDSVINKMAEFYLFTNELNIVKSGMFALKNVNFD